MFASGKSLIYHMETRSRGRKGFVFHVSASTLRIIALCYNPGDFMTKLLLLHALF